MNKRALKTRFLALLSIVLATTIVVACSGGSGGGNGDLSVQARGDGENTDLNTTVIAPGEDFQTRLLEAIIGAQPGDVIELPESELAKVKKLIEPVKAAYANELEAKGLPGKRALAELIQFGKQ